MKKLRKTEAELTESTAYKSVYYHLYYRILETKNKERNKPPADFLMHSII